MYEGTSKPTMWVAAMAAVQAPHLSKGFLLIDCQKGIHLALH